MRRATRMVAALFGAFAGFGGPEHGIFEMLQGNTRPDSLVIAAMGPPCDPEKVWNLCEPAMTIVPSFLATGILATLLGLITMVWSALYVHKRNGGLVLILLCAALLLAGGGLFPPIIGMVAGLVATRINRPFPSSHGVFIRTFARLWPWPIVAFFVFVFGQFVVGYYANDWFSSLGFAVPVTIVALLILSIFVGYAYDRNHSDSVAA